MSAPATSATPAARHPVEKARTRGADVWLFIMAGIIVVLHLQLALTRSINWDEFYFLTQVHQFSRGELTSPLQTLHVQVFYWLADTDYSAVDQIIRGRIVMFAAMIGTCAAIALAALRFTDRAGALICVLAYLTFGYVMQHGTAFRTDPIAAFFCMSALAAMIRSKLNALAIVAIAGALAIAVMVTIKMVLYAPAFAAIAWLRWSETRFSARRAAAICAIPALALSMACGLYLWHNSTLGLAETGAHTLGNSGATMFGLSPNLVFAANAVPGAVPFVLLLFVLGVALVEREGPDRASRIALAGLASPLLWLVFYTNTYPYFYAFILPPVCVALAGAIPHATARWGIVPTAAFLAANGVLVWTVDPKDVQDQQRQIEQTVNQMFPAPVAYFDFPGFLPRHQKANFFMTVWGFRNYHAAGEAHFAKIMAERPVPLLLAIEPETNPSLLAAMNGGDNADLFHPDDLKALRESYRAVWGPVYLAGTSLGAGQEKVWTVRVPGEYTVEGTLLIDGRQYERGDVVTLQRGELVLAARDKGTAGLIWGNRLKLPQTRAPSRPYWRGF